MKKIAAAIMIVALIFFPRYSQAATYTVTTDADSGAGSFRQAILDANAGGPVLHTISFDPALDGSTITLSSDLPTLTEAIDINCIGYNPATITL